MANKRTEPTTPLGKYRRLRGWSREEVGGRIVLVQARGEKKTASDSYVAEIERDLKCERLLYRSMREDVAAAYDLPIEAFELLRAGKRSAKWAMSQALGNHGATDSGPSRNASQAERAVSRRPIAAG